VKAGWAAQRVGADARERIVELTDAARAALPAIRAEWEVTAAALAALDVELPYPLTLFVSDLRAARKALGRG
jgi:DNA-binding MarR family transcriptional regulator